MSVTLEERRFDERPLSGRKGGPRHPHCAGHRTALEHRLRIVGRRGLRRTTCVVSGTHCGFDGDVASDSTGAQPIDGAISRDAREPRSRRPEQGVVCVGARPHAQKRLLQHFFRVGRASQNAHDDAVGKTAVSIVELGECAFVADGNASEEAEIDLRTAEFHCEPTIAWPSRRPQARPFARTGVRVSGRPEPRRVDRGEAPRGRHIYQSYGWRSGLDLWAAVGIGPTSTPTTPRLVTFSGSSTRVQGGQRPRSTFSNSLSSVSARSGIAFETAVLKTSRSAPESTMASMSARSCVRPAMSFMRTMVSTGAIGTPSLTGALFRPSSMTRSASVSGT